MVASGQRAGQAFPNINPRVVRDELRVAVRQLSDRGLRCSSKWAAEQLVGLRPAVDGDDHEMAGASSDEQEEESDHDQDVVLLAKAYFDSNEFLRAAPTLIRLVVSKLCSHKLTPQLLLSPPSHTCVAGPRSTRCIHGAWPVPALVLAVPSR